MEAGRLAAVSKQLKGLKAEQFKKGQQLFGLRNQEREWISEINGSNAQSRNLTHKLRQLDEKVGLAASIQACSAARQVFLHFPLHVSSLCRQCLSTTL